jgi:FkbM family methyltransferase
MRNPLGRYVARNRRHPLVRAIARKCGSFLESYRNLNYDQAQNGEVFVLERLSAFPLRTVFDVGANVGDWTTAAAAAFPAAALHAFEICPPTFQTLEQNTRGLRNVHRVNTGLAEKDGTVEVGYYEGNPALTTVFEFHRLPGVKLAASVTTGARYCARLGIEHIDLLKIDVEGMENLVLEGFAEMIDRGAVDVIQFEYGQVNILSKFLLRDFHCWFSARGYVVGKIYPNYVDFRDYDYADEDFTGPNYLACRRVREDYIRALSGS